MFLKNTTLIKNSIVIGGGAAGFFAAIAAARRFPNQSVLILEASRQPLHKVRISGGGRCNVTHNCFDPAILCQSYPRGSRALRGALSRFQPQDTIAWFAAEGVTLKTEPDGRLFPTTDSSETIIHALRNAAHRSGVELALGCPVVSLTPQNDRWQIALKSGECLLADRVLLATGSSPMGYQLAQSLGHTIVPPVPSLFTFRVKDDRLSGLAGISVDPVHLKVTLPHHKPLEQSGPILITHWGFSGPAVLKLSAWGARLLHDQHYQAQLTLNWLPHLNLDQVQTTLRTYKDQFPKRSIVNTPLQLPQRLWEKLVIAAQIPPQQRWADLSKPALHQLTHQLTQGSYTLLGKGVFKEEFVTCGGVSLAEVNFKTMESRSCPRLHFAGEILDIDGLTGGFNFQNAWTTGWLAGQAMAPPASPLSD